MESSGVHKIRTYQGGQSDIYATLKVLGAKNNKAGGIKRKSEKGEKTGGGIRG